MSEEGGNTPVGEADRLRRGVLSAPEVFAQSVSNMGPTGAMALLPALVFVSAGNGTWLSWLIALGMMMAVAMTATVFAKRLNSAGSFYTWVTQGLGPGSGHTAGWALLLGYVATGIAVLANSGLFFAQFLDKPGIDATSTVGQVILYILLGALAWALAHRSISLSARTGLVLEVLSITVILVIIVAAFVHNGTVFDTKQLSLKGVKASGVTVGIVLVIFSFVGFESAGVLGMEARNPRKMIGPAILFSCLGVGLFNMFGAYSQIAGFHGIGLDLAKANAPLPNLASSVGISAFGSLIEIGIGLAQFACALACINAAARILLTMGQDGIAPEFVRHTHPVFKTPSKAIAVVTLPVLVVPTVLVLGRTTPINIFGEVGTLAAFGFMLAYALCGLSAAAFLHKRKERYVGVLVLGIIGTLSMAFVFWASWIPQIPANGVFSALTYPYNILPYIFLAWTAIGIVYYLVVKRTRPEVTQTIGTHLVSHEEDFSASAVG